jgi:hypothetical protein
MLRIGGFQSFRTARRTIRGFEAMLWLRKGFVWTPSAGQERNVKGLSLPTGQGIIIKP